MKPIYHILLLAGLFLPAALLGQVRAIINPDTTVAKENELFTVTVELEILDTTQRLGSFTGFITWDPSLLSYVSHSRVDPSFEGIISNRFSSSGELRFNGIYPEGSKEKLEALTIDFRAQGKPAQVNLDFSTVAAALTFKQLTTTLSIQNGTVTTDANPTTSTSRYIPKPSLNLTVYPIPFEQELHVSYQLPENSSVEINLYSLFGQKVAEIFTGFQPSGEQTVVWKLDQDLAQGMYLLQFNSTQTTAIRRVLLQRKGN